MPTIEPSSASPPSFAGLVIDLGEAAIQDALDVGRHVTRDWRLRDNIPTDHWPQIIALAQAQGRDDVDMKFLLALFAKRAFGGAAPVKKSIVGRPKQTAGPDA